MVFPTAILVALAAGVVTVAAADEKCTCFRTSSDDIFTNYQFYDFRAVDAPSGVPKLSSALPTATYDDDTVRVGTLQSGYIASDEWASSWAIQDWGKAETDETGYTMWNSLSNVFIDRNTDGNVNATTKLVLRTKRFDEFQSAAEVENVYVFLYFPPFREKVVADRDCDADRRTFCMLRPGSGCGLWATRAQSRVCFITATAQTKAISRS